MNAFRALLAALLIGAAAVSAGPVLAAIQQVPERGTPAWLVDVGPNVRADRDDDGDLALFPQGVNGFLMLQMIVHDEDIDISLVDEMAEAFMTGAKAEPISRSGATTVDGLPGRVYHSRVPVEGHPPVGVELHMIQMGPRHMGLMVLILPGNGTAADRQAIEALARSVRIARATI